MLTKLAPVPKSDGFVGQAFGMMTLELPEIKIERQRYYTTYERRPVLIYDRGSPPRLESMLRMVAAVTSRPGLSHKDEMTGFKIHRVAAPTFAPVTLALRYADYRLCRLSGLGLELECPTYRDSRFDTCGGLHV